MFGVADAAVSLAGAQRQDPPEQCLYAGYVVGQLPRSCSNGNLFARVGFGHIDAQQSASAGGVSSASIRGRRWTA